MVLAVAALAAAAGWCALPISLSVRQDRVNLRKDGDKSHGKSGGGSRGWSSPSEVKTTTVDFSGRISCSTPPKEGAAEVTVEAYFISRKVSGGIKDEVGPVQKIGTYSFGPGQPTSAKFNFSSPEYKVTTEAAQGGGRNGGKRGRKISTGEKYVGIVVRAVSGADGVLKVVTIPTNATWQKAAKQPNFSL